MFRRPLLTLALLSLTTPALAQSHKTDVRPQASRVTGEALTNAFSGYTHEGAYNFSREGRATDFYAETHLEDGEVSYVEGGQTFPGRWWVARDSLCFAYKNPNMPGGCFRVYQVGTCYYYYSETYIEHRDELDRDYWTARSVQKGDEPTCEAVFS